MTDQRASELLAVGRFLDQHSSFADAAVSGALSRSQITLARRLHRPKYASELASQERELVGLLASSDIEATAKLVEHWKNCADAIIDDREPPLELPCELTFARTIDDRLYGTLAMHDAAATEFEKAILNASTWEGSDDTRTLRERQGDALYDIAIFYNKNHTGSGTPRHLPSLSLSADVTTITSDVPEAVNDDTGRPLSPACTGALLCDCTIHVILRNADGTPRRFGRAVYSVPRVLFRQVAARDGGCRFPGCNRTVRYTDAHHVRYWEHGGPTDYSNLLLLCRRHHTYVHRERVCITLGSGAVADFTWANGDLRSTQPRGAPARR